MACCPPGSLGAAPPFNQLQAKGGMVDLAASENRAAMPCYRVGPEKPKRLVLVFPDIYGIHSGMSKVVCDVLQEKLGDDTAVWMPDIFRGRPILGAWGLPRFVTSNYAVQMFSVVWACMTNMAERKIDADLKEVIAPACIRATENVAASGFCYGAWIAAKTLALEGFPSKAAAGIHPSWALQQIFGKTEADLARAVGKKPVLLLPASNDELKVGTEAVQILAQARGVEEDKVAFEFSDMIHGWSNRGDSSNPAVKEAQHKATTMVAEFIKEHVEEK